MNPQYGYNCKEGGNSSRIPEEIRKKISNKLKGNIISKESREKISRSLKGTRMGINNAVSKRVVQYDMQGNFIKVWDSIADAERELNIARGNIAKCCKGKWKTIADYIWRYYGEEPTKEYIDWCNKWKNEKSVAQYSLSGELISVFKTISEATLKTGIHNISDCCRGNRKTAGGFIWKYYEDIEAAI